MKAFLRGTVSRRLARSGSAPYTGAQGYRVQLRQGTGTPAGTARPGEDANQASMAVRSRYMGGRVPPTPPIAKRRRSTSAVSSFSFASNEESLVLDDDLPSDYSYSYSSVANVAVMSRTQRREVFTGLKELRSHDQALHTCLTTQPLHVATLGLLLTNHPDGWSHSQDSSWL